MDNAAKEANVARESGTTKTEVREEPLYSAVVCKQKLPELSASNHSVAREPGANNDMQDHSGRLAVRS